MLTYDLKNLPSLILNLWKHLRTRRRFELLLTFGLMCISALAEVVSLGVVLPFLGALTAPERVFEYPALSNLFLVLGITNADQIVLPMTVIFALSALVAGAIRVLLLWWSTRVACASGSDLSFEIYRRTLYQPYLVHMHRNSSEVISGLSNKVTLAIFSTLLPILNLASSTILTISITLTVIIISPVAALVSFFGLGLSYALITWIFRKKIKENSSHIAREQTQIVKASQEGIGGIRDVLLDGTQAFYSEIYRRADIILRRASGNNHFYSVSPRYGLEALGMIIIAAFAYYICLQPGGVDTALPLLGALALSAQRLLPAMQQIYSSWANIAGNHAPLNDIINLLNQPLPKEMFDASVEPLEFRNSIQFVDVRFRYSSDGPWIINGLNLSISRGTSIGFVGSTGSGKSTLLDILMGLLQPSSGKFLVDHQPLLGSRLSSWQKIIAHVPQSIFLADTTLAENIALGVPYESIDMDRVASVARQAQIADFIESRPMGYKALVGERGLQLSGGQRQRIGIARALYKQAKVLVLDEATSALDSATEQSVINSITALDRNIAILIIAHRLSTIKHCDTIIQLDNGRIVAKGTYEELIKCSPSFRKLAGNA